MAGKQIYDKEKILNDIHDAFWQGIKQAKIVQQLTEENGMSRGMAYKYVKMYMEMDGYKDEKVKLHNTLKNQLFATANSAFSMGYSRVFLETVDRIMVMFPSLKEEVEIVNDISLEIRVVDKKDQPG